MTPENACIILEIPLDSSGRAPAELSLKTRTLHFRRRALAVHPDKNPAPDANAKFCEAREAADVLNRYYGDADDDADDDGGYTDEDETTTPSYIHMLRAFAQTVIGYDISPDKLELIMLVITHIATKCDKTKCEASVMELLRKLDRAMLLKIREFFIVAGKIMYMPTSVIEYITEIIEMTEDYEHRYTIYATLDDLLECNVHILEVCEQQFVIPLWATEELVYDLTDGTEITVVVIQDTMCIDKSGNIDVDVTMEMKDIWDIPEVSLRVGKRGIYTVSARDIGCVSKQTVVFRNRGAPQFNDDMMFDANIRGDLRIRLHIT